MYTKAILIEKSSSLRGTVLSNIAHIKEACSDIYRKDTSIEYVLYNIVTWNLVEDVFRFYFGNEMTVPFTENCVCDSNLPKQNLDSKIFCNVRWLAYKSDKLKDIYILGEDEDLEKFCRKKKIKLNNPIKAYNS